jgi:hypothetical protein
MLPNKRESRENRVRYRCTCLRASTNFYPKYSYSSTNLNRIRYRRDVTWECKFRDGQCSENHTLFRGVSKVLLVFDTLYIDLNKIPCRKYSQNFIS